MTRRFSLLTAAIVAALGSATASHAGMIIATYQEASGATGIFGTSSSGQLSGGKFIGVPPSQFNPVAYSIRGQPDFFDTGVLYNEGLEASIFAIADRGYEGTLTIFVTYFDTLADPGTLHLALDFEVDELSTGWTLTMEDYGDPADFPFPVTTMLLGSAVFTAPGSTSGGADFANPAGLFSLTTIFKIAAPTPGLLTATARITAEQPTIVAVPEPSSQAVLLGALAGFVAWVARRRRASRLALNAHSSHACVIDS